MKLILGVEVELGRSVQVMMPASVSNAEGPTCIESTERIPDPDVYCTAPPSTVNPPMRDVVALLSVLVLILKIGVAVLDVAMVQAYGVLSTMVVVAFDMKFMVEA